MNQKAIHIIVYGAQIACSTCAHAPSSKDTFEWLEAALKRKYQETVPFVLEYVNVNHPIHPKDAFAQQIIEEQMIVPVIVINDEIISEGNPRLKLIFDYLDQVWSK
ncbi:DUF1462 family protein [Massilibacterium senegalense]|uniref:DUF1462 family protein n=1 Tax=Massilibacterium senegalense TaxID=1632858 RepID=UPI000780C61E|nr:DUF1462 family protein [Massilibacterium senegalense]